MNFGRNARPIALRARTIITMAGERAAVGRDLLRYPHSLDNGQIIIRDGRIVDIGKFSDIKVPSDCQVIDLGDVCIFPPLVNAHMHLQLSWLEKSLKWGEGFVPWLKSMVPLLLRDMARFASGENNELFSAIERACAGIFSTGTIIVAETGGSIPGALHHTMATVARYGFSINYFCEWLGWQSFDVANPWPPRCRPELLRNLPLMEHCSPCGHSLYSTSPDILRGAHEWCRRNNRIFSFHLAESESETEMLASGTGPLREFYEGSILPAGWTPPGMTPYAYAQKLGILGPGTLAVHGVHIGEGEITQLASSGAFICLCPRSNHNLGVGTAPIKEMLQRNVKLCLGTDGLTSASDLDVRNEALWLRDKLDVPSAPLLRLLTVNGAEALGFAPQVLEVGSRACFSTLPESLTQA